MKKYFALLVKSGPATNYMPIFRRVEFSAPDDEAARKIAEDLRELKTAMPERLHSFKEIQ